MTSGQPQNRLRGIDSLRGLAALAVVLFHYTTGYEFMLGRSGSGLLFYLPTGCFGVQLFFLISGFVILRTLERTSDLKTFAVARFARLYPPFFVCATLTLIVIALTHWHLANLNAKAIAINYTMLAQLIGVKEIDPSYWTLTYEVLFYAGAALIWFRLRPKCRLEVPCLIWLGCSLAGHLVDDISNHHRLSTLINVDYANLFVLGMMLYYLSQGRGSRLTIPTFGAALLMALFPPGVNAVGVVLSRIEYISLIASFWALIWLASNGERRFLDFPPLVFLGEISYSLYLVHQVIGFTIIHALLRAGMEPNVAIFTTIAFIVALAACLRIFVEKPAERWIKNSTKPPARAALAHRSAHAGEVC
jgi:peptidoglycan/LPS O-acetylase OafA/YrhL